MATGNHDAQTNQLNQDNQWAGSSLNRYNSAIDTYNSNVNAAIGAGNPYKSQDYLTNQNLMTSSAMNAGNTRGTQELRDTARRTGTNTAALAKTISSNAREGQRDLTNYNATRDTANEDKWLNERDNLMRDQLAGANSEAGVYGTSMGGANNALGDLTSRQNAEDAMWSNMIGAGVGAAGTMGAAGISKA